MYYIAQKKRDHDLIMPDWDLLRKQSLLTGGFGNERVKLWPELLHATIPVSIDTTTTTETEEGSAHADTHQIKLDTDRSFVLYPSPLPNHSP